MCCLLRLSLGSFIEQLRSARRNHGAYPTGYFYTCFRFDRCSVDEETRCELAQKSSARVGFIYRFLRSNIDIRWFYCDRSMDFTHLGVVRMIDKNVCLIRSRDLETELG